MPTKTRTLRTTCRSVILVGLALVALLTPLSALAARRNGTILFFSFEDLAQALSKPTLPDLSPSFLWQNLPPPALQESPLERNYPWGNDPGVYDFAYPGARLPLWGY